MAKIGIIGSGIAGLVAARALTQRGREVVVLEKSRSLAGRCATRRWLSHIVDHGAQYVTATRSEFLQDIQNTLGDDLMILDGKVINESGDVIPASGAKRYYYASGNNRIGKVLSDSLEIHKDTLVQGIVSSSEGGGWTVEVDSVDSSTSTYDAVLVTTPWPQTQKILGLAMEPDPNSYTPCLTAFFEFSAERCSIADDLYAISIRDEDEPLAWSAYENRKVGRIQGDVNVFVVQASEKFSRQWLEAEPEEYLPLLQQRLQELWNINGHPINTFAHRWRFARKAGSIALPQLPDGIFLAGDSRVESKIEAVWMNGIQAASEVDEYLRGKM